MPFSQLGLQAELTRATASQGYTVPTPIQAQAVPAILGGRDVLAGAQTGTGKTAAFTLPMLQRLAAGPRGRAPRALVLTPTRELAAQVCDSVATYGRHLPLRTITLFGGVGIHPQKQALKRGVDIVVATPGRLLDHLGQGSIDLGRVEILVLDEADRMLDMGFIHDIRRILARLPAQRQNLMFSATYADGIRALAGEILRDPVRVEVARQNTAAEKVSQRILRVDRARKRELLVHLFRSEDWERVLVFARTKRGADRLARQLDRAGITADAIHGNKTQGARTRVLREFKRGKLRALVATDIAARGLDIDRLPQVVNFELPQVAEDYVHRIGRTGRAGSDGAAWSLVDGEEIPLLRGIERLLRRRLEAGTVPGFEPRRAAPSAPAPPRRARRGMEDRAPRGGGGSHRPRRARRTA